MLKQKHTILTVLLLIIVTPVHASWFSSITSSFSNAVSYVSRAFGFGQGGNNAPQAPVAQPLASSHAHAAPEEQGGN